MEYNDINDKDANTSLDEVDPYRACSLDFEKRSILADSDLIVKSGISDSIISDKGHLMYSKRTCIVVKVTAL